jgi:hypothetical protein
MGHGFLMIEEQLQHLPTQGCDFHTFIAQKFLGRQVSSSPFQKGGAAVSHRTLIGQTPLIISPIGVRL